MKSNPFNRKASDNCTELNVTPFLSLMVVLIPVLLISARFSLLAHYDIYSRADDVSVREAVVPYVLRVTDSNVLLSRGGVVLFEHDVVGKEVSVLRPHLQVLSTPAPLTVSLESSYSYQEVVSLFDVLSPFYRVFPSISVSVSGRGQL